ESFDLFQSMMERIQDRVVKILWKIELAGGSGSTSQSSSTTERDESARVQRALPPQPPRQQMTFSGAPKEAAAPQKRMQAKVGRNDPCPCGSGKKYKKCHGENAA
ncbi:MAG TPA: SEC-C metal-binding domain-containing protein, partial [Thermoanaerobaculia bacterium]